MTQPSRPTPAAEAPTTDVDAAAAAAAREAKREAKRLRKLKRRERAAAALW